MNTEETNKNSASQQNIDSPINTRPAEGENPERASLTPDEDSSTDPNEVPDKPSFTNSENDMKDNNRGRFDGEIGI